MPSLWTNIFIYSRKSLNRVSAYLERSTTLPLTVSYSPPGTIQDDQEHISTLFHHSRRWRCFVFMMDVAKDAGNALLGELHAPQLECLRLDMGSKGPEIDLPTKFRIIPPLASLTTLELAFLTPHATLTLTEFRDMVSASPNLATLSLRGRCINFSQESSYLVVELRSVLSLTLGGVNQSVQNYIEHISAPSVTSLTLLDMTVRNWDRLHDRQLHFPKYPALRSLIFVDSSFNEDVYDWFPHLCPTVTTLTVADADCKDFDIGSVKLIAQMAESRSHSDVTRGPKWPKLHTITLGIFISETAVLHDVVAARLVSGNPLTKLRLDPSLFTEKTKKLIQDLRTRVIVEEFEFASHPRMCRTAVISESSEVEIDWTNRPLNQAKY